MCPGIDPAQMSFWEYTARCWHWDQRDKEETGGSDVAPPSADKVERMFAKTRMN